MIKEKNKILLVQNGIFPITKDALGNDLNDKPDTDFNFPQTVQGEGKLIGVPCLFIRTSSCNLNCAWVGPDGKGSPCDTPYSSWLPERNVMTAEEIYNIVKHNTPTTRHIVISGGEPMVQAVKLIPLLRLLKQDGYHITIETNGTIFNNDVAQLVDLFSISPKLSSSTPQPENLKDTDYEYSLPVADRHERIRKNTYVIQQFINACYDVSNGNRIKDFQLKFVVSRPHDIAEIENDFLKYIHRWKNDDIVLMPEGTTVDSLSKNSQWVVGAAIEKGWRFTPRLHALLWGIKKGV